MLTIRKKLVMNEDNQPVAVQIDYEDWLEIERQLGLQRPAPRKVDISQFAGILTITEDPLEYQRRIRDEWDEE